MPKCPYPQSHREMLKETEKLLKIVGFWWGGASHCTYILQPGPCFKPQAEDNGCKVGKLLVQPEQVEANHNRLKPLFLGGGA